MKITLLANRDLASNLALNQLLPRLTNGNELRVFLSGRVGRDENLPEPLHMLQFFEQKLFNDIVFPALERNAPGNGPFSFRQLERFTGSPITALDRINSESGLTTLASAAPDLIISIRYGSILKDQAIAIPEYGVINLHSGLLPDYRGVMATFHALLRGETEIGTTLHFISDGSIDTGDIIGTTGMPVFPDHSYLWHVLRLYPQGCELLLQTVDLISSGQAPARRAQAAGGNYFSFPGGADLERFTQSGHRLYDINEITEIARNFLGTD